MLERLLAHHLVFVGGKGGVGKTTVAAAVALAGADRGQRCLLVSTDPAHSLGDIFERPVGSRPRQLEAGLWGLEIDPDAEAERHVDAVKTQMKTLVHPRLYDEIDRQLDLARHAPGAAEAALLERIATLMGDAGAEYDVVVFDTAPSGHTVRLLSLPEVMGAWMDGLLRRREHASRLSSALKHLGGGQVKGDDLSLIDAARDQPPDSRDAQIHDRLQARRRTFLVARERLVDAAMTSFLLVLNADKLSLLESQRVATLLDRFGVGVWGVVLNRLLPEDAEGAFLAARRAQEQEYRAEIDDAFAGLPRVPVPLLDSDVRGTPALRRIGHLLAARGETPRRTETRAT